MIICAEKSVQSLGCLLCLFAGHNKKPAIIFVFLFQGVYEGVTGIVTKPVAGAKEEGISGFFKGVGKGLIGAVARPAAGVVDFASGSFDAVKR